MPKNHVERAPSVSVVVAIYNTEAYLGRCIDSILGQTYSDLELILVDDGSKDGSLALCESYAKNDGRVRVIHQDNSGQTVARQNGLKQAKGEYVLIFDSDDWLELNALEVVMAAAMKNKADIVTFNGYFNYTHHRCPVIQPAKSGCFDKTGLVKEIYPTMIYSGKFFLFGVFASMWNKLFKRELILPIIMSVDPRVRIYEDGLATFTAFLEANKICVLGDEYLYNYRDNQYSLTRSYCKDQFNSTLIMINALRDINHKYSDVYDLSTQIDYFYLYVVRSIMIEEFYYHHKKKFASRLRYIREMVDHADTKKACDNTAYLGMTKSLARFYKFLSMRFMPYIVTSVMMKALEMRLRVYVRRKLKRY